MEFKRGRKSDTDFMDRMCWESRCGNYRVAHVKSKYGNREYYLAEAKLKATGIWWPIEWKQDRKRNHSMKKYQKRKPAEKACEEHSKRRE